MKLSDYIAQFLSKITDCVFVGQGGNIIHVLDSLGKRNDIKVIPSQNEQGASIAADAYSRFEGKIGVTAATSGPGMINLMQGIACSFFDSIPTFHFSGAVVTAQLRKNKNIRQIGFQEMEVVNLVKPITKYAVLLKDKNLIRYELEKMLYYAKEGRPGPVLMDLPDDLQRAEVNPKRLKSFKPPKKAKQKIQKFEKKFISLLNKAKRPLLILGHGINLSKTNKEVKNFIKKTGIPFSPSWATIDLFKHDSNLNAGTFGVAATRFGNFAVQNSDLLISLGCRLNTQITGSNIKSFATKAKKIVVDIDQNEFKKNNGLKIDLKVNLDLKNFFKKISPYLKKKNYNAWIHNFKVWKKKYPITKSSYYIQRKRINPYVFMKKLSDKTGKKDVIIPDASANLIWAMQAFEPKGQKIFTALNHSPMGYSMPATIGAYLADKSKNIICTIGDGSMQMNIQELATISHFKFPVKIFVLNNKGYGLIKLTQDMWLNSRRVGVDEKSGLAIPNITKIAKAYGIETIKINNHKEIDKKIDYILKSKKPIVCDVIVNENQKVIPKLEFGRAIHDLSPRLDKEEINSNLL